ncbi:hypothetical protein DEO72_LG7g3120 [Vigna unguiculata]|uniref:Uncharacterized protein n=1 Tax=Vigna unguiculata TaxID=3917 RepID=A0A4D6MJW7_VIGUN|nr:hypothetical protein DEO72_LG7g3120 [Vigna unguiculata]
MRSRRSEEHEQSIEPGVIKRQKLRVACSEEQGVARVQEHEAVSNRERGTKNIEL